jgi:hypothetical protein
MGIYAVGDDAERKYEMRWGYLPLAGESGASD